MGIGILLIVAFESNARAARGMPQPRQIPHPLIEKRNTFG
jgi:hypothetical protein